MGHPPTTGYEDPEPHVVYYPETGTLYISTLPNATPLGDGDTIAKDVVVFYDHERGQEVVAVCIQFAAPSVLKPMIDAVLAEHGLADGTIKSAESEAIS